MSKPESPLDMLMAKLEQGVQDLFLGERYEAYLKTMSQFHDYSVNNTILICMQRPDASYVAGYQAWQKNFKRQVRRGERGIKILAPCPYKVMVERKEMDLQTQRPITKQVEITRVSFKPVTVFDISQTEGASLPQLGVYELTGNVEHYAAFLEALRAVSPYPVALEEITTGAKGYCNYKEGRIAICKGMSQAQTVKTAIHEISHAKLHAPAVRETEASQGGKPDRYTQEVEAESVAYVVCQHFGIDTSEYSFGYVAAWSSSRDAKELKASLETIRHTASTLISDIAGRLPQLQKDRGTILNLNQPKAGLWGKKPPAPGQHQTNGGKCARRGVRKQGGEAR